MDESQSVVMGDSDDELELVAVGGVLDRLHNFSKEVLKRDESAPTRCKYPDYIEFLCKHIGAREKISVARVYSSLVKIGYGIVYSCKDGDDADIYVIADLIGGLRASISHRDQHLARVACNVILFDGGSKLFRYSHNFIAETHEYAENMNVNASDLYLYYCLIGLIEIGELSEYEHLKNDIGYIKAYYELEKTNTNIKLLPVFLNRFL